MKERSVHEEPGGVAGPSGVAAESGTRDMDDEYYYNDENYYESVMGQMDVETVHMIRDLRLVKRRGGALTGYLQFQ